MMDQEKTAVSDIVVARAAAEAVTSLPGVADLSPGQVAEVATYGPGETVRGVAVHRVDDAFAVDVHVIARYTPATNLQALANRVRWAVTGAVESLGAGRIQRIDVTIDDLRGEEG